MRLTLWGPFAFLAVAALRLLFAGADVDEFVHVVVAFVHNVLE